jgi:hypothetical protein
MGSFAFAFAFASESDLSCRGSRVGEVVDDRFEPGSSRGVGRSMVERGNNKVSMREGDQDIK